MACLGKKLPSLYKNDYKEINKVSGCMSQVWFVDESDPENNIFKFRGDSDSDIVKGLIAILKIIYSGKSIDNVFSYDIEGLFNELNLYEHLTSNRRNGFYSMLKRLEHNAKLFKQNQNTN